MNHYTTFFTQQSQKESLFLMDTGVTIVVNEKYTTAASGWIQVSRHVVLNEYTIKACSSVCGCVCVCVCVLGFGTS